MVLKRRIEVVLCVYLMLIGLPLLDRSNNLTRILLCLGVCINSPPFGPEVEVEALGFIPDSLGFARCVLQIATSNTIERSTATAALRSSWRDAPELRSLKLPCYSRAPPCRKLKLKIL